MVRFRKSERVQSPLRIHEQMMISFANAADMAESMDSRIPRVSEFIFALKDPAKLELMKGHFYWVEGDPEPGDYRIDYGRDKLVRVPEEAYYELPLKERAYVPFGFGRLAVGIDYNSRDMLKFIRVRDNAPNATASVALMPKNVTPLQEFREMRRNRKDPDMYA